MSITQPPVGNELTKERVLEAVAGVQEPAIGRSLVELRMIPAVEIEGGRVNLIVELLSPIAPYRDKIEQELKAAAQAIPGVETVEVTFHTRVRPSGSGKADADPIAGVRNTIAVASG